MKLRVALMAALMLCGSSPGFATSDKLPPDPQVDAAPCIAAAGNDADTVIAVCGGLIDNPKTAKPDRIKALIARAGAYDRKDMLDNAIADADAVLWLDPTLGDMFNTRGKLWRRKGDRRRALADFAAATKLNPQHPTAGGNHKSLAQELERLGALMAVYNKPGINCTTTGIAAEKAICANPELATLDREINAVNSKVVRAVSKDSSRASALQREQDDFVSRRNAGFGQPGYDLARDMRKRLEHLLAVERY